MSNAFLENCHRIMLENGLAPAEVLADGELHRCPTSDKPQGKDGAYIIHLNKPYTLWWGNHRTGQDGIHTAKSEGKMTKAERQAFNARAAKEKEQREKDRQDRQAEAAQTAQYILSNAPKADDTHPYLVRKQVPSLGLFLGRNNELIMPIMGADGKVQSLQFIPAEEGKNKRLLTGGKKAGGFFHIPAKDGSKDGTLCIAEGYATAASIHLATGFACLVAIDANNLQAVAHIARANHPERTIILCADNDPKEGTTQNVGIEKATKAAQSINGLIAVCPLINGRKADFNDLHVAQGTDAVKAVIGAATTPDATTSAPHKEQGYFFEQRKSGLWHVQVKEDGDTQEMWICSPLTVLGQTRDNESNAWGLYLQWDDQDHKKHTWAMPKALLVGRDTSAWLARLVDEGLQIAPSNAAKGKLALYLSTHDTTERILCVNTTGWHGVKYIFPDTTIEESGAQSQERTVLQTYTARNPYTLGGCLEAWQSTIGEWARGNSRLMLAISAALSAVLLEPTGTENGGFNFVGGSSTGKTTTLTAAATVFGKGTAQGGYIQSWRATDNGLEGISCLHNDACLCLDELGQAPARVTREATYMLANGAGKSRAKQDGSARQAKSWRTIILSTGEKTIAEKIAEDGGKVQAGQEVRLVDIPADAGAGLGIFEELHGHDTPRAFADAIKQSAATHYGHLARGFISQLIAHSEAIAEIQNFLLQGLSLLIDDERIDGQVQRVGKRFLLAAAAGETAAEWGLLPWQKGEAIAAAKKCFEAWLSQRGGTGAHEDKAILEQVMLFMERHGQDRFQDLEKEDALCINRVGFKQHTEQGTTYFILPQSFKSEVCKGINVNRAAKLLADEGILLRESQDRFPKMPPKPLPGIGRKRCYTLHFDSTENNTPFTHT